MSIFSRRLKTAAITVVSSLALATAGITAPQAFALGPALGTVIDYAAGVPDGAAIKEAGHIGSVRYVSQRRPGAEWMLGKPVTVEETKDQAANGLKVASVYQFGKEDTADWKEGAAGAAVHAPQAIQLHTAAGGPKGRPIYVAIDDNPSREQYDNQIRPYLKAFDEILKSQGYTMGIYANYGTIDWAIQDGLGSYFWQHDWGSNGQVHPRVNLHQEAGNTENIDGIEVDVNDVYTEDWGQWTPGQAAPATTVQAATNGGSKLPVSGAQNQSVIDPKLLNVKNLDAKTINQLGTVLNGIYGQLPGMKQLPLPSTEELEAALRIAKASS
ncbi:MAG: DUF1906 domain-containing protein [Corynebacterium sp.]|nr:DUF1906 domain-containing protein [Corynebacterium sp.]